MEWISRKPWVRLVILLGIVYPVIGVVFATLPNPSVAYQSRVMRLAAWVICAVVYAAHIGYERFRLGADRKSVV